MLQVPIFGMENNPDSLIGRRKGYCIAYGYDPSEWETVTEVIGHVPNIPAHSPGFVVELLLPYDFSRVVTLEFWSSVVPYSRMWVKVKTYSDALDKVLEFECGNLWRLERVS